MNTSAPYTNETLLQEAHLALLREDWPRAQQLARAALAREPGNVDAQGIAATSALKISEATARRRRVGIGLNPWEIGHWQPAAYVLLGALGAGYSAWHLSRLALAYATKTDYALPLWTSWVGMLWSGRHFHTHHSDSFVGLAVLLVLGIIAFYRAYQIRAYMRN